MNYTTLIGLTAAVCTTASYLPRLKKCWQTRSADDLSLKMFLILATGIALWVLYGVLRGDAVIILANAVSLCLLGGILYFKLRELFGARENRSGETASMRREDGGAHPATVGRRSA